MCFHECTYGREFERTGDKCKAVNPLAAERFTGCPMVSDRLARDGVARIYVSELRRDIFIMEQYNKIWNGKREMSIGGMLFYILKKWRVLVALVLIGALAGCGISLSAMKYDSRAALEALVTGFSDEDANKEKVRQYADYVALYESQVKREENSLILKMDANSVWTGGAEWLITTDEENIDAICARFNSVLLRDGTLQEILDRSGLDCSEDDFRQMITFAAAKVTPDQMTVVEGQTTNRVRYAKATISVWYTDEQACRKILDDLTVLMSEVDGELAAEFSGAYESSLLSNYMNFGYSDGLKKQQINTLNTRMGYLKTLIQLKNELTPNEMSCYKYYYEEPEEETTGFSKVWPAGLAIVFAVIGVAWFAFTYLLDGHLKDEEELGSMFGLKVLGVTEEEKKHGLIDKWLRKLEYKNSSRAVDCDYLRAYLGTMKVGKMAICVDSSDGELKKLAGELAQESKQITVAGDLAADSAAPGIVSESDGIVLITRMGKSAYTGLRHIAELANGMEKKIVGAIIVR